MNMLFSLLALVVGSSAISIPSSGLSLGKYLQQRQSSCENTATSRDCWGDYSIDTNYYETTPDTGNTVEYWLSVEEVSCAPDGYLRTCLTFNGTVPGPTLIADWGDTLIIHITNNLSVNGTSIHWHGIRQLGTVEYDGVPGVTQCPIAPGSSMTYEYRVTQYGSTWYHSHFSLQYADGLFGALILNGPASANYDEDLGALFLQDWGHKTAFENWETAKTGVPPTLENGLINGTNTYDCSSSSDSNCLGNGTKFEAVFESGKKYLLRVINVAIEGYMQFSIDGHTLTVIGTDLVPIQPYTTDGIHVNIGQRYDVIVEANAESDNYWLRSGWLTACAANDNAANITGIVRYDSTSTADPTSTSNVTTFTTCGDESVSSLVPYLALNVTDIAGINTEDLSFSTADSLFRWTINSSSLDIDWANPTLLQIFNNDSIFPTDYNVVAINAPAGINDGNNATEWTVLVIEDESNIGLDHPIHLHGHDFWVLAQETEQFDGTTSSFNTNNPPRRDVAILPGNGYLAIAFKIDNPGAWLVHCHIAWHASQGLALEFVENQSSITIGSSVMTLVNDTCSGWNAYVPDEEYPQEDSGI